MEDFELNSWREQWGRIATPAPDLHQLVRRKLRQQQVRFIAENLAAVVALIGGLAFALVLRHRTSELGTGWATGVFVLMFLLAVSRMWLQRGTWRADSESTLDFVELWQKRVAARLRMLRLSTYTSPGWLVFCALLTVANWSIIGPQVKAHPVEWLIPLVLSAFMVPLIFFWIAWFRRRKEAELREITEILRQMAE
jgi:hypothetical protein